MLLGYMVALVLGNWQAVIPAVIMLGAGFALCHTTLQTRATELSTTARGTAISLFAFSLFLGSGVGTAALGIVLDHRGYDGVLLLSGVALGLVALFAPRLTAPVREVSPAAA
jgi:predicted MFS family arabinose efflux permease